MLVLLRTCEIFKKQKSLNHLNTNDIYVRKDLPCDNL